MHFVHESTLSLGYKNIRCPSWIVWRWNCGLKSKIVKNFPRCELQWLVQKLFFRNCCICSADTCTRTMHLRKTLFRTVVRSPECFPATGFPEPVLEKIPKSSHLVHSRFLVFLCSRILLCPEIFLVPFRLLSYRIAHTNSKLIREYWADSHNECFGTRVLWLKHPDWSVGFLFLSPYSQDSTTQCIGTCEDWATCFLDSLYHVRRYWIPASFRRVLCFSIPLLFISRTEERPVSLREVLRVCLDFFWIRNTSLIVSPLGPINIVEHWHEDDPICEFFRVKNPLLQVILDFLKNLQWRKSWETFHSNSIASPSIPSNSLQADTLNSSSHLVFAFFWAHIFPRHSRESEYTRTFASVNLNHLIMRQCRSRPWGRCTFNPTHIQNLFGMFQRQFECDIE